MRKWSRQMRKQWRPVEASKDPKMEHVEMSNRINGVQWLCAHFKRVPLQLNVKAEPQNHRTSSHFLPHSTVSFKNVYISPLAIILISCSEYFGIFDLPCFFFLPLTSCCTSVEHFCLKEAGVSTIWPLFLSISFNRSALKKLIAIECGHQMSEMTPVSRRSCAVVPL